MSQRPRFTLARLPLIWLAAGTLLAACGDGGDKKLIAQGEQIFQQQCTICHAISSQQFGMTGPYLGGIVGRKAAAAENFAYSDAFAAADFVWDEARLDAYLAEPLKVVPGNAMGFFGMPDADARKALVAYLAQTKK